MEVSYTTNQETKEYRPTQIKAKTNTKENNKQQEHTSEEYKIQECYNTGTQEPEK